MYNLLISLAVGLAVALAIRFGTNVGWVGSVVPGVFAFGLAYFLLARRTFRQVEALFEEVKKDVMGKRVERAVQTLQRGFALAPWQFLVATQLHSQLGVLFYVREKYDAAQPHLEKSYGKHWVARVMLALVRYRRRDLDGARKAFEETVKSNKKEGLAWASYAWVLEKEGRHADAVEVMGRAAKANPSDEKVKAALHALQNDKRLKLGKLYGQDWYQFMLERIPAELLGGSMRGGRRVVVQRR
jgi:tetratricopeptide (TPR) repeat protein